MNRGKKSFALKLIIVLANCMHNSKDELNVDNFSVNQK